MQLPLQFKNAPGVLAARRAACIGCEIETPSDTSLLLAT